MLSSCDTQIYNMYRSNMAGMTLCRLLLAWVFIFAYPSASQDCCMFNQWEGSVYFGSGAMEQQTEQSDVTRLSFTNGSGMVSYDLTNSRSYLLFESYTTSSDSTIVRRSGAMLISDYNMGVQYVVSLDNQTCQKISVTGNMTTVCASAFLKRKDYPHGELAEATASVTNVEILPASYDSSIYAVFYKDGPHCLPLLLSGTNRFPGSTSAGGFGIDILDIQEGIPNPDIFKPPSYCPKQISGKHEDLLYGRLSRLFLK